MLTELCGVQAAIHLKELGTQRKKLNEYIHRIANRDI